MIKRLQRKFVVIAAVCLLIVEFTIIGGINGVNIYQTNKNADDLLNIIIENEINDLLYHVMVLAANQGLEWSDVEKVLDERNEKIGNLKKFHQVDKNT